MLSPTLWSSRVHFLSKRIWLLLKRIFRRKINFANQRSMENLDVNSLLIARFVGQIVSIVLSRVLSSARLHLVDLFSFVSKTNNLSNSMAQMSSKTSTCPKLLQMFEKRFNTICFIYANFVTPLGVFHSLDFVDFCLKLCLPL